MLCFYCHSQETRGTLKDQKNKEVSYIYKGFTFWKKAPKCFYKHQDSACHHASSAYHLVIPSCSNVGEMIDDQLTKRRRKYLIDVIKCLRYLARQGIPLQGCDNNDNLTQTLLLLGTKDDNITTPSRSNRLQVHTSRHPE